MLHQIEFKRKASCNNYKNKRLMLAEMRFGSLPLTTERGDLYPRLLENGSFQEACNHGIYHFTPCQGNAACARLVGRFNPYSTYDLALNSFPQGAKAGFVILWEERKLFVYARRQGDCTEFFYHLDGENIAIGTAAYKPGMHFLFTFHAGVYVETYVEFEGCIQHVGNARIDSCRYLKEEHIFSLADAAVYLEANEEISVSSAVNYLDCGIMQADIKPIKYEDGSVLIENGKIYLTYTSRFEEEMMQQIASYKLSTCEFQLEGALLFDAGDDQWCGDVASSLIYDRQACKWRIWMCVFSHGHVLAYGETAQDPRFGINVMDVKPLPPVQDIHAFGGRRGDEDPDLYYDETEKWWYLSICRLEPENKKYRYYLFRSREAEKGYVFHACTQESLEVTGGSFVRYGGNTYFVFGRSFSETSKYDCYSFPECKKLGELKCNHPDGGFRGWGSVMEIPCGTRKRLLWVTFDRTRGSQYNWSYGNLYFFESATIKE